jgi:saccharopine dehydrogenase-like NADP-dependent oxidoreductase
VFTVLNKLGLLSEQPVRLQNGEQVVPLHVVKALLPDPASLAADYQGLTCIGNKVVGQKNGQPREVFIYNVCDHAECYREVGSQAISYTAGVPAVAAAMLIARGDWDVQRMANVEELPPQPLLALLDVMGLPTRIQDAAGDRPLAEALRDVHSSAGSEAGEDESEGEAEADRATMTALHAERLDETERARLYAQSENKLARL